MCECFWSCTFALASLPSFLSRSDGSHSGLEVLSCVNTTNPIYCQSLPLSSWLVIMRLLLWSGFALWKQALFTIKMFKMNLSVGLLVYGIYLKLHDYNTHTHVCFFITTSLSESFREMGGNAAASLCLEKLWTHSAVHHLGRSVCARRGKNTLFCLGWEYTTTPGVPNTAALRSIKT